jgi:NTP pyrophosphatase (non-canonical NTP hydrolase)
MSQDPTPPENLTLADYQRESSLTDLEGANDDPMTPLLGLAGEVGSLIAEYKKKRRPDGVAYAGFEEVVKVELGDILWYLASLARRVDVSLNDVALLNLQKTRQRWLPPDPARKVTLDDGFPETQRLPRQFTARFSTYEAPSGTLKARMQIDGEYVGDTIDDNARDSDDYRFHDAFHLGYLAVLGWSPILRALLKRKRKDDPATDNADDGARACATEEAITAMVFALSRSYNHFDGAERVDDRILDAVRAMTVGLEVAHRTAAEWESAILAGFTVWRALRASGEGVVSVDMDAALIEMAG